ncbi:MAG: c-type cytochrome [Myxococcaceae bacterium]
MRRLGFVLPVFVLVLSTVSLAAAGDANKGKPIYNSQCVICHGKTGDGNGPVGKSLTPKPKAFSAGKLPSDDELFKVIQKGGKANGLSKDMDGYPQFSDQQIWDVIAYIKTLAK